jgi:hypothetical protein
MNFKITNTVLHMEGNNEKYSLLLGHPWLREAKVHHDQGRHLIVLTAWWQIMEVPTHSFYRIQPYHQPLTLHVYDWQGGFTEEEEEHELCTNS